MEDDEDPGGREEGAARYFTYCIFWASFVYIYFYYTLLVIICARKRYSIGLCYFEPLLIFQW